MLCLVATAKMLLRPDKFADQNPAFVADQRRIDVLVCFGRLVDRMNVHPAFVRERALANERLAVSPLQIGGLVDIPAEFGQMLQR